MVRYSIELPSPSFREVTTHSHALPPLSKIEDVRKTDDDDDDDRDHDNDSRRRPPSRPPTSRTTTQLSLSGFMTAQQPPGQ
jgi:hypothetical protein